MEIKRVFCRDGSILYEYAKFEIREGGWARAQEPTRWYIIPHWGSTLWELQLLNGVSLGCSESYEDWQSISITDLENNTTEVDGLVTPGQSPPPPRWKREVGIDVSSQIIPLCLPKASRYGGALLDAFPSQEAQSHGLPRVREGCAARGGS